MKNPKHCKVRVDIKHATLMSMIELCNDLILKGVPADANIETCTFSDNSGYVAAKWMEELG